MHKEATKQLLVFGEKTFRITIPADAAVTFGPFSPPSKADQQYGRSEGAKGTLRIYAGGKVATAKIIAVFTGVKGFRDLSIEYEEQVLIEQGSTIWKNDANGYARETSEKSKKKWVEDPALLEAGDEDEEDL